MTKPRDAGAAGKDPLIGAMLADRYRVDGLVDKGAMGRVYVGEHVLMKKRVAIKVLHPELVRVPEFVARFEREAMAAANIDNEHVVAGTDFGKLPDGAVFLVLEFVEGKNLRDEISLGPIPLVRTLHIARQIAFALRSAHARGIVHRDLKPENVMLVEKAGDPDFVKVLDFGIAKVPTTEHVDAIPSSKKQITSVGMVIGTPEYMAPEQALGQDVDARADLYSLGVIVFEMLAGMRPFLATSRVGIIGQQLANPPPNVAERAPGVTVPPSVDRFVHKLLQRDPNERYASADAVLDALDKYLGYAPGRARVPTLRTGTFSSVPPPTVRGPSPSDGPDTEPATSRRKRRRSDSLFAPVARWVDARRPALPKPLRTLPAPLLLSMPFAVVGMALGFAVMSALSDRHPPAEATAGSATPSGTPAVEANPAATAHVESKKAPPDELVTAGASGVGALRELAKKYPEDASVEVAIAGAELKQKHAEPALRAITSALDLDKAVENDAQVASALWILSQNKATTDGAFALLEGPMGDRGASILHDLATTEAVRKSVRDRARAALAKSNDKFTP